MGLAKLSKVTVIAPRSEYGQVAKALAQFEDFHPVETTQPNFDPVIQELDVKAVRLFAQSDQAVKDLSIQLMPGTIDIVFRGVKIPRTEFRAETWDELLNQAETKLTPIADEVKSQKSLFQKAVKDETDAQTLRDALESLSNFSADLSELPNMHLFKVVVAAVSNAALNEFRNSLPDAIFVTQPLGPAQSIVMVALPKSEESRLDKTMKALEIKPLVIPTSLPQNPAEAYLALTKQQEAAGMEKAAVEARLNQIKSENDVVLLAIRELTEAARVMLDEARISGNLKRLAMISGFIPEKRESEFKKQFGRWIVYSAPVASEEHGEKIPSLVTTNGYMEPFELITSQQGTPGHDEVDPTPLISFVFPAFFGLMFGDFGHGLVIVFFALLIRQRSAGNLRQWGNVFLVSGLSAVIFGAIFGEFFGLSLKTFLSIPPVLEIMNRPEGVNPTINTANIETVMVIAILIGIAHLTIALSLDVYETAKMHERLELLVEKIPTLTMYLSGVGYGLAFIGAGYNFDVLKPSGQTPLLGIANNELGVVSVVILFASMIVLFSGKGIATLAGKMHGESAGAQFANGGLEVFERISQFLSNTISYVRLAIMLLVHAVLLLIVNQYFPITNPVTIPFWVVLNCLVITFEAFVVYVQDLRLHIYEFFTKFYRGSGVPFRKILPDRVRVWIDWT